MSWLDGVRHRLRTLVRPRTYEEELQEEMQLHVELDAQQQGDPWAARRRFGNRTRHMEEVRRHTWLPMADAVRQDASYALRSMRRSPAVALLVTITLALGIGANAATFTLIDELYLRAPRGVRSPETLRRVWIRHFRTGGGVPFTTPSLHYPLYQSIAGAMGGSSNVALFATDWGMRMGGELAAPRVRVVYASPNYFDVLGVRPARGRLFTTDEGTLGKGAAVVVVSDAFWRDKLGARADAVGQTVLIGRTPHSVVGVLGPAFRGLNVQSADAWVPLATYPQPEWMREPWWQSTNQYALRAVARVPASFDEQGFAVRATSAARTLNRSLDGPRADTLMTVVAGSIIAARGPGSPSPELLISTRLAGGAALLLLIACANAVNLLLVRGVSRRREIALRMALGVSRRQLMRLLTVEALLLTAFATAGALLVAAWGGSALRTLLLPDIEWSHPVLDSRVAAFTAVVGCLVGLIAAVVPALQASRGDVSSALAHSAQGGGGRHRSRLRGGLVVVQAALAVVLLCGAALFVRSLRNVQALDIGFDADQLLFAGVRFADGATPPSTTVAPAMREVARRLRGRAGVAAVAAVAMDPMQGFSVVQFYTGGDSAGSFGANEPTLGVVSPEYFAATGLRIISGVGFSTAGPGAAPREIVINDAMARILWRSNSPLGACITFGSRTAPCFTIVGVVETARRDKVIEEAMPQYYASLDQPPFPDWLGTRLVVRVDSDALDAVRRDVRALLQATWPTGEAEMTAMRERLEPEYRPWRLGATLFTTFGVVALLVAVVGIYGIVSYGVSQRRREFGVRMALGAGTGNVLQQVVGESARTIAVGIVFGAIAVVALSAQVADLVYGISPRDPATMMGVGVLLLTVATIAALFPAWRATRVDPVETLRAD
ncbi:MAG: ABC transporter permease [Gemmatimonadetes bacterium]|nr:ABC transporter permease [Gemmatimonadota bacterium]